MPPSILSLPNMNNGIFATAGTDAAASVSQPVPFTVVDSSLKRKRPPMLEIPNVLQEIRSSPTATADDGGGEATPRNFRSESDGFFSSSGFGVGVCSVKGKKLFMEDAHKIVSSNADKSFFGVYDGHGGSKAAEFVAKNLHSNVYEMLEKCSGNTTMAEAVKAGFIKTDDDFLKQGLDSGACCVTVLIEGKDIVISNLGDCRAVLSKKGKAEAITKDHRASRDDERKRIQDMGGYVEIHRGMWRVHGVLAVSRSIGDAHLKDWVVAEPETKILPLTTDMEYLVLASDGLWDEVGNQEAIDIVTKSLRLREDAERVKRNKYGCITNLSPKLKKISLVKQVKPRVASRKESDENYFSDSPRPSKARRISLVNQTKTQTQNQENCTNYDKMTPNCDGLVGACKELVNLALSRGSLDDITVMVVDLKAFQ